MALSHAKSKYPEVLRFAKANPLPATAEGLALGILDLATLAKICKGAEAASWASMTMTLIMSGQASRHPGAFLSNPAMLLSSSSVHSYGSSHASCGAGCLFAFPHYQEDSLGQALLLCAMSPRTLKMVRSPRLYAQALDQLKAQGLIEGADVRVGADSIELEELAWGPAPGVPIARASMDVKLLERHIAPLDKLRADLSARAVELALSDDKAGLFLDETRERLRGLVHARRADAEAEALSLAAPKPASAPKARRAARM